MAKAAAAAQSGLEKYTSGGFKTVIEQCEGCGRVVEVETNRYCQTFLSPEAKWRLGICNFATHAKPEVITASVKVNPLKASKRAANKGKK